MEVGEPNKLRFVVGFFHSLLSPSLLSLYGSKTQLLNMDKWERNTTPRRRLPPNASFSSSLLRAIDCSIDEADGIYKGGNRVRYLNTYTATNTTTTNCFTTTVETKKHHYGGFSKLRHKDRYVFNPTSTSSESSYGAGLSSSEPESVRITPPTRPLNLPVRPALHSSETNKQKKQNPKSIGNRFRASKVYAEIKKAKPPVSPGGRLSSFVNQLFTSTSQPQNAKTEEEIESKCKSKNPNKEKRSVRFYLPPRCCPKFVSGAVPSSSSVPPLPNSRKRSVGFEMMFAEDEIMDDVTSCSSSDLFELENLTGVRELECYTNELPVYETTDLVIAQGLVV